MRVFVASSIALASLVAAPRLAPADAGPDAGAEADAGSDAGAAVEAGPKLDDFGAFVLPAPKEEKSPPPKPKEWEEATETKLVRGHYGCKVRRVREWMKINCDVTSVVRADVVTGSGADVFFFFRENVECFDLGGDTTCSSYADVVFPIRRGDRRAIQIIAGNRMGYAIPGLPQYNVSVFISETWLEDEAGPTVTVTDAR